MYHVRRLVITAVVLSILTFLLWLLPKVLNPTPPTEAERLRDQRWVQSSPYWADRQACRWLSLCGIHHVRWDPPALPDNHTDGDGDRGDLRRRRRRAPVGDFGDAAATWENTRRAGPGMQKSFLRPYEKAEARVPREVPAYVLKYAPLVHLYSGENFWPSDIAEHIKHMRPYENGTSLNLTVPVTLANLAKLNKQPLPVYLTSHDNVESRPEWLHSHVGIPSPFDDEGEGDQDGSRDGSARNDIDLEMDRALRTGEGSTWYDVDKQHPMRGVSDPRRFGSSVQSSLWESEQGPVRPRGSRARKMLARALQGHKPDLAGYSKAPAILVLVDKGSGVLDAFWFFFYSYNLGQTVLDVRFGNHVGDWEHCMVRFESGVPRGMFLSEHAGGKAFAWQALEKRRTTPSTDEMGRSIAMERPVIYSAVGSHAMYATPGLHPYVLPFKLLADVTDRGPLWDPALNNLAYWYDYEADDEVEPEAAGPAAASAALQAKLLSNTSSVPTTKDWTRFLPATFDPAAPVFPFGNNGLPAPTSADEASNRARIGSVSKSLKPAASNPDAPTSWFFFAGPWGDALYPLSDSRQWRLFGQYHYHTGPLGPRFKNLKRHRICQTERCRLLWSLEEEKKATWYS